MRLLAIRQVHYRPVTDRLVWHRLATLLALVVGGCLDPQVADGIPRASLILAAGTTVPSIYDTPDADKIRANDGVDGTVPLYTAFVDGALVHFWDFGPAPARAAPLFRLVRATASGVEPVDHPPIFAAIPGDSGYSPFWTVFDVTVTGSYQGELITSQAALNEAQTLGLVGSPKNNPTNIDCPVVDKDVRLDLGGGQTAAPTHVFYYDGYRGLYYNFSETKLAADNITVPATALFELHREGGEPLSEPERHVDLDGDGDTNDTNDILPSKLGDADWSPLCRVVSVAVPSTVDSIDTTGSEDTVELDAATDLFTTSGAPVAGTVLGYTVTERLFNCPQLGGAGSR